MKGARWKAVFLAEGKLTCSKALRRDTAFSQRNYKEFRVLEACSTKDVGWGEVRKR